jgi:hypothetical protein
MEKVICDACGNECRPANQRIQFSPRSIASVRVTIIPAVKNGITPLRHQLITTINTSVQDSFVTSTIVSDFCSYHCLSSYIKKYIERR